MDPSSLLLNFFFVLVLVGINAYLVAAEFAVVAVRRSRVEQLVRAGDARARRVMHALDHPDDFISAAQLGITLASIGIGYLAEATLHGIVLDAASRLPQGWLAALPMSVDPGVLSHGVATVVTLALVTYLHVVLGEQVPKMISIQRAESVALVTVGPTQLFGTVLRPFIRFMSASAAAVMRLFGLRATGVHTLAHTPEEIQILVEQSQKEGEIEEGEEQMIRSVFEFGDLVAREVMTPRRDLVALPVDASRDEVLELVAQEAHSRLPVYEGSLDNIVGVLLAKDLIAPLRRGEAAAEFELRRIMREPYFIPDTKPVSDLLTELRSKNVHLAVVLDEFGGTHGIVTLEDLLEEIVGDIYDEYDDPEPEDFTMTPGGDVLIEGGAAIDEANARFGLALPEQDFDTIGGLVFGELGRVPEAGDEVRIDGALFRVEGIEDRRVTLVRLLAREPHVEAPAQSVEAEMPARE